MRYLTVVKKGAPGRRSYKRKRYTRRKASKGKYGTSRVVRNKMMGTAHGGSKHHFVRKSMIGFTPTTNEVGSSITDIISNQRLKGSPSSPNGNGGIGYVWKLTNFPNQSELVKIYQYYKINRVTVTFYPEQNSHGAHRSDAQNVTFGNTGAPKSCATCMVYAIDRTNTALFASVNEALEHEGSKLHVFNGSGDELTISFVPTTLTTAGPVGSTITVPGRPRWIPTTSDSIEHFGLRVFFDRMSDYVSFRVVMQMTVEFKDAKF